MARRKSPNLSALQRKTAQLGEDAERHVSELAAALLGALDEPALDRLAEVLAPRLTPLMAQRPSVLGRQAVWLDVDGAAGRLACPKSRIYALVSAKRIPYYKDSSRLLFRPEELDAWVRAGGAKRP
jgi:excisionase family DNA binding protein